MTRDRKPNTSALTLSGRIPFGLAWKKSRVTNTTLREVNGSKGEVAGVMSAASKRSLIASSGKGAVICTPQKVLPSPFHIVGIEMAHGLHLLPSISQ